MDEKFQIHLPYGAKASYRAIEIKAEGLLKKPFFSILHESGTVKSFINAVASERIDDAKIYLSKRLKAGRFMDFEKLMEIVKLNVQFKQLDNTKVEMNEKYRTNSILIMNEETKNSILHLHLVKEPDQHGYWKIYGIERE